MSNLNATNFKHNQNIVIQDNRKWRRKKEEVMKESGSVG